MRERVKVLERVTLTAEILRKEITADHVVCARHIYRRLLGLQEEHRLCATNSKTEPISEGLHRQKQLRGYGWTGLRRGGTAAAAAGRTFVFFL